MRNGKKVRLCVCASIIESAVHVMEGRGVVLPIVVSFSDVRKGVLTMLALCMSLYVNVCMRTA